MSSARVSTAVTTSSINSMAQRSILTPASFFAARKLILFMFFLPY
jgi:hypothetical protein